MPRPWLAIAKAEFLVTTSRFRRRRLPVSALMIMVGIVWAMVIVPLIMRIFLDRFSIQIQQVLQVAYPGVMRSVILILWTMVLVFPISQSLQEIKIGQWEIMLSHRVTTRDMMFGMFLGKIPSYAILVLFMTPVLVSPFVIFYDLSIAGQLIAYFVIAVFVLVTLLLSTVLSTAIQAKLGDSPRGNDIAKAMGLVVVLVFLLPIYSLLYFAETFAELLGLNVFLLLPSTWLADLLTWLTIYFNGIGLPPSSITVFEGILGLDIGWDLALIGIYLLLILAIGFITPDRIFSLEAGARTEVVTTLGKENMVVRVLRRALPGPRGVLVVIMLKDFGRKAQNTSRLVYAILLSIIIPTMVNLSSMSSIGDPVLVLMFTSLLVSMVLGILGGVAFGGVGFLESKDHLWTIKSAPRGVSKFLTARIADAFLLGIPIALLPVFIITLILSFPVIDFVVMSLYAYAVLCSTILVGIGITAMNPAYEDTRSLAFGMNTALTVVVSLIVILLGFVIEYTSNIITENAALGMLVAILPIMIVGPLFLSMGALRLSRLES